jgi:hypothetical protein
MTNGCSICQRTDSRVINEALAHGEPVRGLAKRYEIPKTTMARHASHAQRPPSTESPPMERLTAESPELVDDVETSVAQLGLELIELHTQLARTQAQLSGVSREFAAWRAEQETQRTQCADDHELVEQLRACLQVLQTDDAGWRVVELLLRPDGHNSRGPFLQQLRRLIGRPVLTLKDI